MSRKWKVRLGLVFMWM